MADKDQEIAQIIEANQCAAVKEAISDPDKIVIVSTSPSVRVGLGEAFGLSPGAMVQGKMISALRALGVDYVFDTNFSADLTIMEEASELVDRIVNKTKPLPQFTSCCPSWINFVETNYPAAIPYLSTAKSPIGMQGPTIKTYFAKQKGIDPNRIVNVALTPCLFKKFEISREEMCASGMRDMDHVITTMEFAEWLREEGVDFAALDEGSYDLLMGVGSGAGAIFGSSGGVMEAALRTAYFLVSGLNPPADFLDGGSVRGFDGVREAVVDLAGNTLEVAVVYGLENAAGLLEEVLAGRSIYHFIEVMNCRGGCVGGPGQREADDAALKARMASLYAKDAGMALRFSHENPEIKALYEVHYGRPLSDMSHKFLHTSYSDRSEEVESGLKYRCKVCGYVHSGELPDDIICPWCKLGKEHFQKIS